MPCNRCEFCECRRGKRTARETLMALRVKLAAKEYPATAAMGWLFQEFQHRFLNLVDVGDTFHQRESRTPHEIEKAKEDLIQVLDMMTEQIKEKGDVRRAVGEGDKAAIADLELAFVNINPLVIDLGALLVGNQKRLLLDGVRLQTQGSRCHEGTQDALRIALSK